MKKILIFSIFISISFQVFSQCNTSISRETDYIIYSNGYEQIEKQVGANNNGDYRLGFLVVYMRISYFKNKTIESESYYRLDFISAVNGNHKQVYPRRVKLTFNDGTSEILTADNSNFVEKMKSYEFYFNLKENVVQKLKNTNVKSLKLIDYKNGDERQIKPSYNLYFKDQINCILNKVSF